MSIFVRDNFCPHDPAIALYLLGTAFSLPVLKVAALHHWTFAAWTLRLFVLTPALLYVVRILLEKFDSGTPRFHRINGGVSLDSGASHRHRLCTCFRGGGRHCLTLWVRQ